MERITNKGWDKILFWKERIPQTAERIKVLQAFIPIVTMFIDKAKRYTKINELSGELLNFPVIIEYKHNF
jgi:hypothetical protein